MATIRKRGKYFGAQVRIPEPDGTWRLVSVATKLSDVNDARRFAQASEQMALKAAASDKTYGKEYCEILLQAIRDAGAARLTESKAGEHLSRISEVARGKPLSSYTVRKWFAEYLRQKEPNVAASTIVNEGIQEDLHMLITDHESREVAKRYTHHSVELLRAAVSKMPTVRKP